MSHLVITHAHPDHVGAVGHVRRSAPGVRVLAHRLETVAGAAELADGNVVGPLRVVATPGHTAGHVSLIDESSGTLFVGDCLGSMNGVLVRAPEQFTADAQQAEQSLHRLLSMRGARMLFAHGAEVSRPWEALDALLAA